MQHNKTAEISFQVSASQCTPFLLPMPGHALACPNHTPSGQVIGLRPAPSQDNNDADCLLQDAITFSGVNAMLCAL